MEKQIQGSLKSHLGKYYEELEELLSGISVTIVTSKKESITAFADSTDYFYPTDSEDEPFEVKAKLVDQNPSLKDSEYIKNTGVGTWDLKIKCAHGCQTILQFFVGQFRIESYPCNCLYQAWCIVRKHKGIAYNTINCLSTPIAQIYKNQCAVTPEEDYVTDESSKHSFLCDGDGCIEAHFPDEHNGLVDGLKVTITIPAVEIPETLADMKKKLEAASDRWKNLMSEYQNIVDGHLAPAIMENENLLKKVAANEETHKSTIETHKSTIETLEERHKSTIETLEETYKSTIETLKRKRDDRFNDLEVKHNTVKAENALLMTENKRMKSEITGYEQLEESRRAVNHLKQMFTKNHE
jgi:hypothetical protein